MIIMILSIFIAITDWPVPIKTMYFFNLFFCFHPVNAVEKTSTSVLNFVH